MSKIDHLETLKENADAFWRRIIWNGLIFTCLWIASCVPWVLGWIASPVSVFLWIALAYFGVSLLYNCVTHLVDYAVARAALTQIKMATKTVDPQIVANDNIDWPSVAEKLRNSIPRPDTD